MGKLTREKQVRHIYGLAGLTLHSAQYLEKTLAALLVVPEALRKRTVNPDDVWNELLTEHDRGQARMALS